MRALASVGTPGTSFSALKESTSENPASLQRQLTSLQEGGLVENFLERRSGTKEYSFYRITILGDKLLRSYSLFEREVETEIALSSRVPTLRSSTLESRWGAWGSHLKLEHSPFVLTPERAPQGIYFVNDLAEHFVQLSRPSRWSEFVEKWSAPWQPARGIRGPIESPRPQGAAVL
jgi:hypothetical protein